MRNISCRWQWILSHVFFLSPARQDPTPRYSEMIDGHVKGWIYMSREMTFWSLVKYIQARRKLLISSNVWRTWCIRRFSLTGILIPVVHNSLDSQYIAVEYNTKLNAIWTDQEKLFLWNMHQFFSFFFKCSRYPRCPKHDTFHLLSSPSRGGLYKMF